MPITIQEIKEHHDQFGLHDMSAMPTDEYRQALKDGALFWIVILTLHLRTAFVS